MKINWAEQLSTSQDTVQKTSPVASFSLVRGATSSHFRYAIQPLPWAPCPVEVNAVLIVHGSTCRRDVGAHGPEQRRFVMEINRVCPCLCRCHLPAFVRSYQLSCSRTRHAMTGSRSCAKPLLRKADQGKSSPPHSGMTGAKSPRIIGALTGQLTLAMGRTSLGT